MSTATLEQGTKTSPKQLQDLEQLISKAMRKVGGRKENDICRYLPMDSGGYMHHFTLRKMKHQLPETLSKMITRFIITVEKPKTVPPKPRAARGSRKRRDQVTFSKAELDHMLRIARLAGDKELIRTLTPKKDLRSIKRDLIGSIRREEIEPDLWACYCEVVANQEAESAEAAKTT